VKAFLNVPNVTYIVVLQSQNSAYVGISMFEIEAGLPDGIFAFQKYHFGGP
jgi:hypothetical protein